MKSLPMLVLALALVPVGLGGSGDRPSELRADLVQDILDRFRAAHGFPGASVAWVDGEGRVRTRTTGFADPGGGVAMTPEHRMLAASIGKSFVAAAVLSLEAEGRLALDDPLSRWLGDRAWFPRLPNHEGLTLRHLLTHSGGLPDHVHLPAFAELLRGAGDAAGGAVDRMPATHPEELVALVLDLEPLFPPGRGFSYSDTGYLLAGLVVEDVAGERWTDLVARRFLRPLGLSEIIPSDRPRLPLLATGITSAENDFGLPSRTVDPTGRLVWNPAIEGAGGGFATTPRDLARWGRAIWSGRAMASPYLDEMLAGVPIGSDTANARYGLGVRIDTGGEFGEVRGHGGWIPGYVSSLRYHPSRDVSIAIQLNTDVGVLGPEGVFTRLESEVTRAILGAPGGRSAIDPGVAQDIARSHEDRLRTVLDGVIPTRMRRHDVPGLNVLVLRGGEVAWSAAWGWADPSAERRMALDAVFRVESLSKPVTAWGVVQLYEAGLVALDRSTRDQLGGEAPATLARGITPRHLLSHTGGVGLGDFTARFAPDGPRPTLKASLEADVRPGGRPGDDFSYSDTGYNLLELLVQEVTGEDFGGWMGREVLDPLGMTEATFDWDRAFADRIPVGHDLRGRPVASYVYPGRASGGLFATIDDMGRFVRAGVASAASPSAGERVVGRLSANGVELLHAPIVRTTGLYSVVAEGYALGHFTETLSDGRSAVWHGGQGYGWMTHFHLVPETGDGIVLLANSQRAWPLFAHVLRAWSEDVGVDPVRMSRVAWAAPMAWSVIALSLAASAVLLVGPSVRRRHGAATAPGTGSRSLSRVAAVAVGLSMAGALTWASAQDYLFVFSVLPGTTGWLGGALATLALALLVRGLAPGSLGRVDGVDGGRRHPPHPRGTRAMILAVPLAGLAGAPGALAGQTALVHVEAGRLPTSEITRSLSGPAAEAEVALFRASLLVPIALRTERVTVVPRVSWSRVEVRPRPLDPAEPVWVEALHDVDLEVLAEVSLGERESVAFVLAPGVASDFRPVRAGHSTLQGAVLYTRPLSKTGDWGGGVAVTNAFGEVRAVPLLALRWRAEQVRVDLLVPTQGEAFWTPDARVGVGLRAGIDGNAYGLGRGGTLEGGLVRYSLADVGPAFRFDMTPSLRLSGSVGVSLRRRLEVEDATGDRVEDAALARGWRVTVGLSWLLTEEPEGRPGPGDRPGAAAEWRSGLPGTPVVGGLRPSTGR